MQQPSPSRVLASTPTVDGLLLPDAPTRRGAAGAAGAAARIRRAVETGTSGRGVFGIPLPSLG